MSEKEYYAGHAKKSLLPSSAARRKRSHTELIEGVAQVRSSLPAGWRVLCAGRPGLRAKLERLVAARGIGENI